MAETGQRPDPLEEFLARPLFHLAVVVDDLAAARTFYADTLGCRVGRSDTAWIDFDFFGYQLTTHLAPREQVARHTNKVDGEDIPVPHFGLIMGWDDWHRAVDHMNYIGVAFRVAPQVRFEGETGEQATFFLEDPAGNCLEFKAFRNPAEVFKRT